MYYFYVLQCRDKTFYAGITTDLARRVSEHNESDLGAKYTRGRRPVKLIYSERYINRSDSTKAELEFKKLSRSQKIQFLADAKK